MPHDQPRQPTRQSAGQTARPTASKGMPALAYRTRDLTKTYGEGAATVHALRGIDLDIPNGEIVVLLGASGSGKSTLLNILGGLDRPTGGTAHFKHQALTKLDDDALTLYRRNHVGFVFQFYNLIPSLTARMRTWRW